MGAAAKQATRRLVVIISLLAAPVAAAPAPYQPPTEEGQPRPSITTREPGYRPNIVVRSASTLFEIPAGIPDWSATDWTLFGLTAGSTLALMAPSGPSPDLRIQRWIRRSRTPALDDALPRIRIIPYAVGMAGYTAAVFGAAWALDDDHLLEYGTLMVEALAVAQTYHVTMKVLVGRSGPLKGDQVGRVYGPTTRWLPGGTPSGHALSVFTMLGTAAEYYDSWWLRGAAIGVGGYFSASLIYNDQHFVSDVIWGGAMGYAVATWVVSHRALSRPGSRASVDSASATPMGSGEAFNWRIAPMVAPGVGLQLVVDNL